MIQLSGLSGFLSFARINRFGDCRGSFGTTPPAQGVQG